MDPEHGSSSRSSNLCSCLSGFIVFRVDTRTHWRRFASTSMDIPQRHLLAQNESCPQVQTSKTLRYAISAEVGFQRHACPCLSSCGLATDLRHSLCLELPLIDTTIMATTLATHMSYSCAIQMTWGIQRTLLLPTRIQDSQTRMQVQYKAGKKILARYGWFSIIPPGTWEYDDVSSHYSNILLKRMLRRVITMPSMREASLNVFRYYRSTELD